MEMIKNRIEHLRAWMHEQNMSAFIIPTSDPHCSEYLPAHWETRQWISGFTGSAGTVVITLDKAALWTDSRYFIQAGRQIEGTGIQLMKDRIPGTPSIAEWLKQEIKTDGKVGLDGWVTPAAFVQRLSNELKSNNITVDNRFDPFEFLWDDRPLIPDSEVEVQPIDYAGKTCKEKIAGIRAFLKEKGADCILLSALDEIAWTLNMRGTDVHCNPVFVSYLLITPEETWLFINEMKLPEYIEEAYLPNESIKVDDYTAVDPHVEQLDPSYVFYQDASHTNDAIYQAIAHHHKIINGMSPALTMKAVKNEVEIRGFHNAMLRDGVALVKFLHWLKPAVEAGGQTEWSIAEKLTALRSQQPLYRNISFDTIAGYQANGAMAHYEPTAKVHSDVKPEGFILIDSGAQYQDGTTDITRTVALGPVTDEQKEDYTLVLKGTIDLCMAKFPQGTTGTQLDILARQALWNHGKNYGHGTGHGVGSYLNVHESIDYYQFRMNYVPGVLKPGFTISDEPGIYREGKYGVRTENILLITPFTDSEEFGPFYQFETITLCPIDTAPIVTSMLTDEEIKWLNDYHKTVNEKIAPFLEVDEKKWLEEATRPISK